VEGKVRRFQEEQPDSSKERGKKALSSRGVEKVNFKVMQIVMQRKSPFCPRRGAELGEAGPWSRFARARWWRGSCARREQRGQAGGGKPPRAAGCF
jgi:hypothetical protein